MRPLDSDPIISAADIARKDTLELLEWPRLCEYLSTFASTTQGRHACKNFILTKDLANSRRLLDETLEIGSLDQLIDGLLIGPP